MQECGNYRGEKNQDPYYGDVEEDIGLPTVGVTSVKAI